MNPNTLPPIIQDWIDAVRTKSTPSHVRENYVMMLDNVARACQTIVQEHRASNLTFSKPKSKI